LTVPSNAEVIPMFRAVAAFRTVLARPHVRPLALSSLLARLPKGMMPLALVLLVSRQTGSYAIAGSTGSGTRGC
jgi:hypothetical protein